MVTSATTTEMLNLLRDTIDGELSEIAVGTGSSDPSKSDTSLENEVFREAIEETKITPQEVMHTIRILASEANGYDLSEAGDYDGVGGMEARYAFADLSKTSDIEVEIRTTKRVRNP
jgi:hypothetical protein